MKMLSTVIVALLLSACAAQYASPKTLKEKLAAVEPEERTRTMRNICLTENSARKKGDSGAGVQSGNSNRIKAER